MRDVEKSIIIKDNEPMHERFVSQCLNILVSDIRTPSRSTWDDDDSTPSRSKWEMPSPSRSISDDMRSERR